MNINQFKIKILYTIIILGINFFKSQENYSNYYFDNFPKTPSVALFSKFGSVQNSEYSGANSPSISLFNVKEGGIEFPLNLNYISGNGIRMRDEASTVGLGWGIPFPSIIQDVQGGYDDLSQNKKVKLTFMYDSTPPVVRSSIEVCPNTKIPSQYLVDITEDKSTFYKINRNLLPADDYFKDYNTSLTDYDASPDIFTCNLFGEKIIFATSNFKTSSSLEIFNPTFTVLNKKGYKISYSSTELFTITDPKGIKYFFNKVESYGDTATRGKIFMLCKIVDRNNRSINIEYDEVKKISSIPYYTQNLNYTVEANTAHWPYSHFYPNYVRIETCTLINGAQDNEIKLGKPQNPSPYTAGPQGSFALSLYNGGDTKQDKALVIKKIYGNFGSIEFNYSDRIDYESLKLENISIKNALHQIKNISFNYSYFESQNSITVRDKRDYLNILTIYPNSLNQNKFSKRLRLDNITINNLEKYSFEYNPTKMVDKDSFAVDYWGYFNGAVNNTSLFANPNDFSNTGIPINDKNNNNKIADINYATAGILEKIIYPTKGYSIFNYELNVADNLFENDIFTTNIISGNGLRLKNQKNYDSNGLIDQTDFKYDKGKALNPLNIFKRYNFTILDDRGWENGVDEYRLSILSTNALSDNSTSSMSSGNYVGYTSVSKIKLDNNNQSNGEIKTTYYNTPDVKFQYKDPKIPIYIPNHTAKNPDNGLIKSVEIFDQNSSPIRKINNDYKYINSDFLYGSSIIFSNSFAVANPCIINPCRYGQLVTYPVAIVGYYPIFSRESLLSSSTTTEYLSNKELNTVTDYTYDNVYNMLSSKKTSYQNGKTVLEGNQYTSNIDRFNSANILNLITQQTTVLNGKLLYQKNINYDDTNHYNPTSEVKYLINNFTKETEVTYNQYDSKGNIQMYTIKTGVPTAIIWDKNQTYPIAKIEGATLAAVLGLANGIINASDQSQPDYNENNLLSELDAFRTQSSLKNYQITTYTYNPLIGVSSITPPSGIREIYKYDTSNRLEKVIDINGNILKEYKYNYASTTYFNREKSAQFTRSNCASNAIGGTYTYNVPQGKYTSTSSQEDADLQAQNDINNNGQNAANTFASCTPMPSCSINFNSSLGINGGGSINISNNMYKATISFTTGSNSTNLPWSSGVKVATINGDCRPSQDYSDYNGQVYYTIKSNGEIIIRTGNSIPFPNNNMLNYDLKFPVK